MFANAISVLSTVYHFGKLPLLLLLLAYGLWVFFAAYVSITRANQAGTLTGPSKAPAGLTLVIGVILDFIVNLTLGSLIFLKLPAKGTLLVTTRLQALVNGPAGWRRTIALWFAINLINSVSGLPPHIAISSAVAPLPPIPSK